MEQNTSWWQNAIGRFSDLDEDGLYNYQEWLNGTNPDSNDTDLDGITDNDELDDTGAFGHITNPLNRDTDGDGLSDPY